MKKLIIAGISLLLVIVMTVTVVLTSGLDMGVKFPDVLDRFTASIKNYTLSLSHTEGGKLNRESGEVQEGTLVDMVATPDEGYVFAGWFSGTDSLLSLSPVYSFTVNSNTSLYARFAPAAEEMKGEQAEIEELRNCDENFTFTVTCARADAEQYLAQNMKIVDSYFVGTEYEDLATLEFVLTPLGNNVYKVSLKDGAKYEKGSTYTATLSGNPISPMSLRSIKEDSSEQNSEATFDALGKESTSFDFTIESGESNVIVFNENVIKICHDNSASDPVVKLTDDGLTPEMEGDVADTVLLTKSMGLKADDIFCIYDGTLDENGMPELNDNTIFGKVISVEKQGNNYNVTYGMPELGEIFADMDYRHSGELNLEEQEVHLDEEEIIEQIRQSLYNDADFHETLAQAEAALAITAQKYGYDIEFIKLIDIADKLDIKVSPKISGNKATVDIEISANFPLIQKHSGPYEGVGTDQKQQLVSISIVLKNTIETSFDTTATLKLKWRWIFITGISQLDFGITNNTTMRYSIGLRIAYDQGSAGYKDIESEMHKEFSNLLFGGNLKQTLFYEKAKDLIKQGGYADGTKLAIRLAQIKCYVGIVSFNFDVEAQLNFDISGSVTFQTTSHSFTNVGVRNSAHGLKSYENKKYSCTTNNLVFTGAIGVRAGVHAKVYVSVAGLSKYIQVGINVGAGVYFKIEGIASLLHSVYGGNISVGAYFNFTAYYKVFSWSGDLYEYDQEWPLFRYGYSSTIYSYVENDNLKNGKYSIGFVNEGIDMWDIHFFKVYEMDTSSGNISVTNLEPKEKDYKISVGFGKNSYLQYDAKTGILSAKKNAPLYFEEDITIEVTSKCAWTWFPGDDVTFVRLPKITIHVIYGDEDAFYAAMDTELQAAFRKLYRQYNNINDTPLKVQFSHIISNAITVSPSQADLFDRIVNTYIDKLFRHIDAIKPTDDGKRSVENSFVAVEPVAYESTMTVLNTMLKNKAVTKGEITQCLENVLKSTVMYNTVIAVSQSNDIDSLSKCFDKIDEGTKDIIMEALNQFEDDHAGNATATELAKAFRTILKV